MKHKPITFPDVDLSHDEGDPRYLEHGQFTPVGDGSLLWNGLEPGFWAGYWEQCVVENWTGIVKRYETHPGDVHDAWQYVDEHPVFWEFTRKGHEGYPWNHVGNLMHEYAFQRGWPEITPHKVNPATGRVSVKHPKRNTKLEWWYEFGPRNLDGSSTSLDYQLDGGAPTYEGCVLAVARKIHKYYGNDRVLVDQGESYWNSRKL